MKDVFDRLWPGSSDEARETLMWMTPFPFVGKEKVVLALEEMHQLYGDDIGEVIQHVDAEFDRIWEQTRPQREADQKNWED